MLNAIFNIVGGILAGFAVILLQYFYKKYLIAPKFKQIFGKDVNNKFHIIYALYDAPRHDNYFPKPDSQVPRQHVCSGQNLQRVISYAQPKAVGYLVNAFGRNIKTSPSIVSDADKGIDESDELSFVSIGGLTNFKTLDLLNNRSNIFCNFEFINNAIAIINKNSGELIIESKKGEVFDYGFIIKIHPEGKPDRTWICCAGFGIWATSGAAWYLSNKWEEIRKWAGKKSFACVIKTKIEKDDSTKVIEGFIGKTNYLSKVIQAIRCRKKCFRLTEISG